MWRRSISQPNINLIRNFFRKIGEPTNSNKPKCMNNSMRSKSVCSIKSPADSMKFCPCSEPYNLYNALWLNIKTNSNSSGKTTWVNSNLSPKHMPKSIESSRKRNISSEHSNNSSDSNSMPSSSNYNPTSMTPPLNTMIKSPKSKRINHSIYRSMQPKTSKPKSSPSKPASGKVFQIPWTRWYSNMLEEISPMTKNIGRSLPIEWISSKIGTKTKGPSS